MQTVPILNLVLQDLLVCQGEPMALLTENLFCIRMALLLPALSQVWVLLEQVPALEGVGAIGPAMGVNGKSPYAGVGPFGTRLPVKLYPIIDTSKSIRKE